MAGMEYPQGSILIENGKIRRVADAIELPPGVDAELIDAHGCLVMPGLMEAHCHVGISEERKGIAGDDCNENVNPVTPWLRALDGVNMMDAAFDDAVRAGITCVMTGPGSSNVVGGQFVIVKTKGRRIDDLIVKAPAAMKVAFGENPKVNFSELDTSPVTRLAIAGLLREELFKAAQYIKRSEKAGDDFEPDFRMECWRPVFNHEIPLKAHAHRVDDIFTAMRIADEFGLDITLDHCSEGHLIAEYIAKSGKPAIVGPALASRSKLEIENLSFKTAGVLNQAGVLIAITTDHPVTLIQSLPICAGLAVRSGLPMEEGLKAITCNPAKICRVFDRIGSLEEGKDADIAIFNGNPMNTFTITQCTIIDGIVVYRREDF